MMLRASSVTTSPWKARTRTVWFPGEGVEGDARQGEAT